MTILRAIGPFHLNDGPVTAACMLSGKAARQKYGGILLASDRPGYAYIWEYLVHPDNLADFEKAYGPGGPWVSLFSQAKGYVRTELHRDVQTPNRYLTIDYWESAESWKTFRDERSNEFEEIDAYCERLTFEERAIAELSPIN